MLRLMLMTAMVVSCFGMQSIIDAARAANQTQFASTLQRALDQQILDLTDGGPYTVLVPTDDAFNRLTSDEQNNLLVDVNFLRDVVQVHVIRGEYFSWDLTSGRMLNTLNGHAIRIYQTGQSVYFNNARASVMDIEATNGVIHLIDEVLDVPEGTIYAVLRNPEYPLSTFADLVDRVSLNRTLDASASSTRYTVFAPSNNAFIRLSPVIMDSINENVAYARELVYYHIHTGTLHMQSLDRNSTITTLDSYHTITVTVSDTDLHLNRIAELEMADIDCDNGVVHVIDHVLIPNSMSTIIG